MVAGEGAGQRGEVGVVDGAVDRLRRPLEVVERDLGPEHAPGVAPAREERRRRAAASRHRRSELTYADAPRRRRRCGRMATWAAAPRALRRRGLTVPAAATGQAAQRRAGDVEGGDTDRRWLGAGARGAGPARCRTGRIAAASRPTPSVMAWLNFVISAARPPSTPSDQRELPQWPGRCRAAPSASPRRGRGRHGTCPVRASDAAHVVGEIEVWIGHPAGVDQRRDRLHHPLPQPRDSGGWRGPCGATNSRQLGAPIEEVHADHRRARARIALAAVHQHVERAHDR